MANAKPRHIIITPEFRVSYPHLFVAKAANPEPNARKSFSVTMLFPKTTDLAALKAECMAVLTEQFGPDRAKWPQMRSILRDGDAELSKPPSHRGMLFATARRNEDGGRPGLIGPDFADITDPAAIYGGCWAKAELSVFYYNKAGNQGIGFGLNNVMKTRDDAPFGDKRDPRAAFGAPPGAGQSPAAAAFAPTPAPQQAGPGAHPAAQARPTADTLFAPPAGAKRPSLFGDD